PSLLLAAVEPGASGLVRAQAATAGPATACGRRRRDRGAGLFRGLSLHPASLPARIRAASFAHLAASGLCRIRRGAGRDHPSADAGETPLEYLTVKWLHILSSTLL